MIRALIESITGYPGLLVACATSGILLPVPEDVTLLYAGARVADGSFAWTAAVAIGIVGVGLRDLTAWGIGRVLGDVLLHRGRVRRWLGPARIERARAMIVRHGPSAVLMGRFVVGFRTPVFAVAGAMGVPFRAFVTWDGVGLLVAVPIAITLGWMFGNPVTWLAPESLARLRLALVAGIAALVAVAVVRAALAREEHPADESAP